MCLHGLPGQRVLCGRASAPRTGPASPPSAPPASIPGLLPSYPHPPACGQALLLQASSPRPAFLPLTGPFSLQVFRPPCLQPCLLPPTSPRHTECSLLAVPASLLAPRPLCLSPGLPACPEASWLPCRSLGSNLEHGLPASSSFLLHPLPPFPAPGQRGEQWQCTPGCVQAVQNNPV